MTRGRSSLLPMLVAGLALLPIAGWVERASAQDAPTCQSLQATISPDKNYYVFTVQVSGPSNSIDGYTFNFGDQQTYHVSFGSKTTNRQSATATHTYQTPGTYAATAYATQNGTHLPIGNCHTNVSVSAAITTLPNTGLGNVIAPATLVATFTGIIAHQIWLRRRSLQQS